MTEHEAAGADDARAALASVERMTSAGARRGRTPCWLRVTFALLLGGFVAAQAAASPAIQGALFPVAVALLLSSGGRNSVMARPRQASSTFVQVAAILGVAAAVLAIAMAGLVLKVKLGWTWAPLALGAAVAGVVFAVLEVRTRAWVARHAAGHGA